jgi:cyclopropane-fatty-acyl-phospholipid synthase
MRATANKASSTVLAWTERGLVPDSVIRAGIRRLCRQRLVDIHADDVERAGKWMEAFVSRMNRSPVALVPEQANEQHYEVPAAFFHEVLGPRAKYSACHWGEGVGTLERAEEEALEITCRNAGIADGMDILDLGCGWGSLSLWIAEHYPACRVTSVSNSGSQGAFIRARAEQLGLENIRVLKADMNDFQAEQRFDRVVSVEMFEHMRNYGELFRRISDWLEPDGRFFMHIFCHRSCVYEFLDQGPSDWMGRHFFSGGIMPSDDLPLRFQDRLKLVERHRWNGRHYEKTANAWLDNMDRRRERILPILAQTYGEEHAERWFGRWRIFFMACAELFGFRNGQEWFVSHYLFSRADSDPVGERRP